MESIISATSVEAEKNIIEDDGSNLRFRAHVAGDEINGECVPDRLHTVV